MKQEPEIMNGTSAQEFVITRELDAPRELVFKAWTEPERLEQWWGPKGCRLKVAQLELRPGGVILYSISFGQGPTMWGRFVYSEIEALERLVYVSSFSDEEGALTRAPFSKTWPMEVFNTLTFTEQEGKTTLTLRSAPQNATEEERKTFVGMHQSLQQGFSGTFDQLADYLAKL